MRPCTITQHAIGPEALAPHLTLEIDSPYHEGFVRQLKQLDPTNRAWQDPPGRWWVAGRHREQVCRWACQAYPLAYLIEGTVVTNLKTGQRQEQLALFD